MVGRILTSPERGCQRILAITAKRHRIALTFPRQQRTLRQGYSMLGDNGGCRSSNLLNSSTLQSRCQLIFHLTNRNKREYEFFLYTFGSSTLLIRPENRSSLSRCWDVKRVDLPDIISAWIVGKKWQGSAWLVARRSQSGFDRHCGETPQVWRASCADFMATRFCLD